MKSIIALVLSLPLVAACPATLTFSGSCSFQNLKTNGCDPSTLGLTQSAVQSACDAASVQFSTATGGNYGFDKNFMDGGGPWNSQTEQNLTISVDAGRAMRFLQNGASTQRVAWPTYAALQNYTTRFNPTAQPYMSNFNLTDSCALRTVMCCYTSDRTTGGPLASGDGNANVCNNDLRGGRRSTHVQRGVAVYDSTVPTYCTGFSWSADSTSDSFQYRGNSLADLTLGTLLNKKFVKNVPGAPMCGCLEQMPVVTNAACRKVSVTNEQWQLTNSGSQLKFKQISATVSFSNCGSSLQSYVSTIASPAEQAQVALRIVGTGNCAAANANFTSERLIMAPGTSKAFVSVDPAEWTQVAGTSQLYFPTPTYDMTVRDTNFRQLISSSKASNPIIYRYCMSCKPTHQHIYYVRITPIPTTFNFLNLFMNNWTSANNMLNKDFELYSNLADAVARTPSARWQVCNYDDPAGTVGFPRDCGPVVSDICQWNSYKTGMCSGYDYSPVVHAFYVKK